MNVPLGPPHPSLSFPAHPYLEALRMNHQWVGERVDGWNGWMDGKAKGPKGAQVVGRGCHSEGELLGLVVMERKRTMRWSVGRGARGEHWAWVLAIGRVRGRLPPVCAERESLKWQNVLITHLPYNCAL